MNVKPSSFNGFCFRIIKVYFFPRRVVGEETVGKSKHYLLEKYPAPFEARFFSKKIKYKEIIPCYSVKKVLYIDGN